MYINTFQYRPEHVDCRLCTEYAGKKKGCTVKGCPWLAERIEAGVMGYKEAVMETFPRDAHTDARLHTAIRRFTGSLFLTPGHERRMERVKAEQGCLQRRDTPAYYAAMYLLTANEDLCRRAGNCFRRHGIEFGRADLRDISPHKFTLFSAARDIYIVSSLEYAIDRLFRCGAGEKVEKLLEGLDYERLLQAVRHDARTVHAYTTQGKDPMSFNYRGADLFGQRATLLYTDFDQSDAGVALAERRYELWLLEDMSLVVTVCVSVEYGGGGYVTEYREIKQGNPWDTPMYLNLEDLAAKLAEMLHRCYENEIPVYEL